MGIRFNADEIYEMAEQIERNGAKFYKEAADKCSDAEVKKMLLDFSAMEEGHVAIFQKMRQELGEDEKAESTYDPDNQAMMYLKTMADSRGTEGKAGRNQKLSGDETMEEIIKIALKAEKESVVFYVGLKDLVSEKAGKDKVDAVIHEELLHIAMLNQKLSAL